MLVTVPGIVDPWKADTIVANGGQRHRSKQRHRRVVEKGKMFKRPDTEKARLSHSSGGVVLRGTLPLTCAVNHLSNILSSRTSAGAALGLSTVPGVRHTLPVSFDLLSGLLISVDVASLVLQMRKLKLRELTRLAQGQRALS